ncbi:Uncharacterized protein dnm_014050 [Desulfonema magnum]|uniref:Uncharacterized protein n=1 Tax=Desulfonema magnum TaxID=45655 RepID=A0A975BH86_9BACT|nr:Uncharacterized protein dnm_014050 [Desulfonema magnum]
MKPETENRIQVSDFKFQISSFQIRSYNKKCHQMNNSCT